MSWLKKFLSPKPRKPPKVVPGRWKGHEPLIRWSKNEPFSIAQSYEGTLGLGGTGAGKSSTLAERMGLSMLAAGYGGYVSTFKPEEAALWKSYGERSGRQHSVLLFGPGHPWRFNFLDYELNRPGRGAGQTENIVHLFSIALEIARPNSSSGRDGRDGGAYWEFTKEQLLRNAIDLSILATGKVSIGNLYRLIIGAPQSPPEVASKGWQERSYCYKCLIDAEKRLKRASDHHTFQMVADYFLDEFPALSEKTRSIIVSSFTAMADLLNRGIGRELLCTDTNVTPEDLERGWVLVPDLPIAEYGQVGRLVQGILRYSFQTGVQRREVVDGTRPVFFFADEFQHFVTSYDQIFQTTCRSARIACVYFSQNIPNIIAALGGSTLGKAQCDSLLANLNHKVFFNNTCATTNEYASTLIGRTRQFLLNSSQSQSHQHWLDAVTGLGGPPSISSGMSETWEYEVQPSAFTTLATGGHANRGRVEAVVVRSGRPFQDTGRIWRFTHFQQQLKGNR